MEIKVEKVTDERLMQRACGFTHTEHYIYRRRNPEPSERGSYRKAAYGSKGKLQY